MPGSPSVGASVNLSKKRYIFIKLSTREALWVVGIADEQNRSQNAVHWTNM